MPAKLPLSPRAHARLHGVYARMAAGAVPALDKVPALVRDPARGSRGESPLHWFALHGRLDLCMAWTRAGGPVEPDLDGRGPWHWSLAAAQGDSGDALALLKSAELVESLAPSAGWVDRLGRDPLGLLCLAERPRLFSEFARAYPEWAQKGVALGLAGRVRCLDGWIASVWRPSSALEDLADEIPDLLGVPSEELPEPLRGGLWTPELWRLALRARLPDALWTRREAGLIDGALSSEPTRGAKSASRI